MANVTWLEFFASEATARDVASGLHRLNAGTIEITEIDGGQDQRKIVITTCEPDKIRTLAEQYGLFPSEDLVYN